MSALGFVAPPTWTGNALCAQTNPEEFFPVQGGTPKHAKLICAQCPVINDCLSYALANREQWGVWGGTTEAERAQILRAGAA